MPLYEYRCSNCEQQAELLVRNQETPACPACGSHQLEKLLSAPNGRAVNSLPVTSACPPPDAPPCGPGCCRM
ncbi:MAG: zinc ribbon domain-containing protein [Planctomycetaceae bacterium]|nr:zinc ribbon domain-containing protein [Planctomycetaceae bacterium]